jgi:hypothetical protein
LEAPRAYRSAYTPEAIADMARELRRQRDTKQDYVVPGKRLRMQLDPSDKPVLVVPGAGPGGFDISYDIGKYGHAGLAERLSIPVQYYGRMTSEAPELLVSSVNTWLDVVGGDHMLRTLDGSVRAVRSAYYQALDNADVFFTMYGIVEAANAQIVRLDLSEERFYVMALAPDWAESIEPGHFGRDTFDVREDVMRAIDPTWRPEKYDERFGGSPNAYGAPPREKTIFVPGIVLSNSEIGLGSLRAELCVFDIICGNRTLRQKGIEDLGKIEFIHAGRRKDSGLINWSEETRAREIALVMSRVRDAATAAFDRDTFRVIIERMRAAEGVDVAEPVGAVQALRNQAAFLTDADEEAILAEFVGPKTRRGQDPGRNLYGLIQAVTARAKAYEDPNKQIDFERLGGEMLDWRRDPVTGEVRQLVPVVVRA